MSILFIKAFQSKNSSSIGDSALKLGQLNPSLGVLSSGDDEPYFEIF